MNLCYTFSLFNYKINHHWDFVLKVLRRCALCMQGEPNSFVLKKKLNRMKNHNGWTEILSGIYKNYVVLWQIKMCAVTSDQIKRILKNVSNFSTKKTLVISLNYWYWYGVSKISLHAPRNFQSPLSFVHRSSNFW